MSRGTGRRGTDRSGLPAGVRAGRGRLVRLFGDIDLAEEAVQEAFAVAVQRWPGAGLPPNPGAWITTTARNRAIDRIRRESSRTDRHGQAALLHAEREPPEEAGTVTDDRLRLIFTCCHPALAPGAQVALTLRLVGGLQTPEIARAFLVPEATMAQRLVRAKAKIRPPTSPTAYRATPSCRTGSVPCLAVVYLVFNEGHTASGGDELIRADLCAEAIRLTRLLAELMPDEPEVLGLLPCYGDLDSDYVFVNLWGGRRGQAMTYASVDALFARLRRGTGVRVTPHMLRHTHATELLRFGVQVDIVARRLTHAGTASLHVYEHLDQADL